MRSKAASTAVGNRRTTQSPGWLQPQEREQRRPSDSSAVRPAADVFPSNGSLVRPSGGGGAYAPAEVSWAADDGRGNGAAVPSVADAAMVAAEVLSSSQTGELMVQADFRDSGASACVHLGVCEAPCNLLGCETCASCAVQIALLAEQYCCCAELL